MKDIQYLEVVIASHVSGYKAICQSFPNCKGIGPSEKEALDKLSQSIARYVAKITKTSLQSVFQSKQYTEVISESVFGGESPKKRIFSLSNGGDASHRVFLTMKSMPEWSQDAPKETQEEILDGVEMDMMFSQELMSKSMSPLLSSQSSDGFTFGFPISLN